MLAIDVGGYTFEAANARHEHEWKTWQDVTLPDGKVIIPGVVSHATNVVEHPELVPTASNDSPPSSDRGT